MSEKLVQYLDGELKGTEKQALEQQLAADGSLQAELDSLLGAREAVRSYGLQQQVAAIHEKMMEELHPKTRKKTAAGRIFRYSMALAASVLLLAGAYLAYEFFTLSPDKMFASRYQRYELITVRDGTTVETAVEKAYRAKQYREIVRMHDTGADTTLRGKFLCGAAALELKDNSKAITCFNEVLEANKRTGETLLNDEAEYYLALSYIRNRDYDLALLLLKKIQEEEDHTYHKVVTGKLIRHLKMLKWR